jgi:hypothetical protein
MKYRCFSPATLSVCALLLMLLAFQAPQLAAQKWVKAIEDPQGDTLVRSNYSPLIIRADRPFDSEEVRAEYYRLVTLRRDVERVEPMALEAARVLQELDQALQAAESGRERRQLIAAREGELQLKLEARLQQLTRQQGEIMVKLIHRQTGQTAHEWMQAIKGKTSAFYWQNAARAGGISLKLTYDGGGEDAEIERILRPSPFGAAASGSPR